MKITGIRLVLALVNSIAICWPARLQATFVALKMIIYDGAKDDGRGADILRVLIEKKASEKLPDIVAKKIASRWINVIYCCSDKDTHAFTKKIGKKLKIAVVADDRLNNTCKTAQEQLAQLVSFCKSMAEAYGLQDTYVVCPKDLIQSLVSAVGVVAEGLEEASDGSIFDFWYNQISFMFCYCGRAPEDS